jgi:hypothetical protein
MTSYERLWTPDKDTSSLWSTPFVDSENGIIVERARPGDGSKVPPLHGPIMNQAYASSDPQIAEHYGVNPRTMSEYTRELIERKGEDYWNRLLEQGVQDIFLAYTDDKDRQPVALSIGDNRDDIEIRYGEDNLLCAIREICALYVQANEVRTYRRKRVGHRMAQAAVEGATFGVIRIVPWAEEAVGFYREHCDATMTRRPVEEISIALTDGGEMTLPNLAGVLPGQGILSEEILLQESLRHQVLGEYLRVLRSSDPFR